MRALLRPFPLVLLLLALFAGPVLAEEPSPPSSQQEASHAMTMDEMEEWIGEDPTALWIGGILRIGSAVLGLVLLVRMWIRTERVRAGVLPAPPRVTATVPYSLSGALVILGCTLVAMVFASEGLARLHLADEVTGAVGMFVTQALLLAAALLVILRRRRLGAEPRRTPAAVTGQAIRTYLIASAVVLPVAILNLALLKWLDQPSTVYKPVEEIVRGGGSTTAWVISALAAILAPIAEESLFRGLLYPALRSSLKARHAALLAAVVTSALFALMHPHVPSWLPLFALALVLTWLFERTNSLAAVMGAHALWNLSTLVPLLIRSTS